MSAPIDLPPSLAAFAGGTRWIEQTDGGAGGRVFRVDRPVGPPVFVKQGSGRVADQIADEFARLRWLQSRASVPKVRHFEYAAAEAWLVTSALPGASACFQLEQNAGGRREAIATIAKFFRSFHGIAARACPFHASFRLRMMQARANLDAGTVNPNDFDEERSGWTPEQIWEELVRTQPEDVDPVVTHGDFSLDNILMDDGQATGCVDVGRMGVADRYQDVAIMWRDLGKFGDAAQREFLEEYGIESVDARKLRFYLCLDELF